MRFSPSMLAIVIVAIAPGSRARAQDYPWCANFADGAGVNCGFPTLQQCMATAGGSGGYCSPNNMYKPPVAAAAPAHQARKHRPRKNSRPQAKGA